VATRTSSDGNPARLVIRVAAVVGLLYAFLVGVSLLESGIAALGEDVTDQLFARVTNPIAGLCVGILATVLVQSSSVSTATIVGLVGSGLLGPDEAVPMIMGANIGTTVTNTLASLGHVRRPGDFQRAFAAATVHDFFNVIAVAILLPVQVFTGLISEVAETISEQLVGTRGTTYQSPVRAWVRAPVSWITDVLDDLGVTGAWFGVLLMAAALAIIFLALGLITSTMRRLVARRLEHALNEILAKGGGLLAMAAGVALTVAVQSSTITTSVLVPLCGAGVLTLRNAYPVTLGANVGTTITALLASLATERPEALTVALTHTTFNVVGILLLYPVPKVRDVPVRLAERLAVVATRHRSLVAAYIIGAFVVVPLVGILVLG
jgi:solute carrier family 34 (sodium-dependent phosphate cotransporter)